MSPAVALREDSRPLSADEVIAALEAATSRQDDLLRAAVPHANAIAPRIIDLVDAAADGAYLMPGEGNLLFWGIHILAAAKCTALYRPFLRLVSSHQEDRFNSLLGDALTATLPRIMLSAFDGDPAPLLDLCAQKDADGYVRWGALEAVARLTHEGAIPRQLTIDLLARFEQGNLAEPLDTAWEGWQDTIAVLGVEELYEAVRSTWQDGRSPTDPIDQQDIEKWFVEARSLPPGDPHMFEKHGRTPIGDPVEALSWVRRDEAPVSRHRRVPDNALTDAELDWLAGLLAAKASPNAMTVEQIDGFFCALNCGPAPAPVPDEYMPVIWNSEDDIASEDTGPAYDSNRQAEYVGTLLSRHWNTIAGQLDRAVRPELVLPVSADGARYWTGGFLRGVAMRVAQWKTEEKFVNAFLNSIVAIGADREYLAERDIDEDLRQALIDSLPANLVRIHHHWRGRPDPFPPPTPTRYEGRKVGRNEPCPCGSGKKFKRCCGSPTGTMH